MIFMPILAPFSPLVVTSGELEICVQGRSRFCFILIFFYVIRDFKTATTTTTNKRFPRKSYQRQTDLEHLVGAEVV